jgi:hypothetical protein
MPPSLDPGRAFVPSHEDDGGFGELLLPATFVRDFLFSLPVPHSAPRRCLAASRHLGTVPAFYDDEDPNG